ncbi:MULTISPECIES: hypothetical protein [Paenibacillus]|uniref:Uncharacterized protein n=1 Tax=Paenibacillus campinasensis TaxID=66347 RepID=A0A268EL84_9BACL|nr:hypothetical protein [Paenibacillus campinasensis]PAD73878.1 hypothetical protein CHH67_18750 [Paenibacillus campinasensis]
MKIRSGVRNGKRVKGAGKRGALTRHKRRKASRLVAKPAHSRRRRVGRRHGSAVGKQGKSGYPQPTAAYGEGFNQAYDEGFKTGFSQGYEDGQIPHPLPEESVQEEPTPE